ncbi:hypothetical protein KKG05_10540 [bacterium]|nr:hypothetical protein [bacterium]
MRKLLTLAVALLWATSIAFGSAEILEFDAYSLGDHCQLAWRTGQEVHLQTFVVERSSDGTTFMPIGYIDPEGSHSTYQFTDASPLAQSTRLFFYRIKIVDLDNSFVYSVVREVSLIFSAFKQTWGSIKAMFR